MLSTTYENKMEQVNKGRNYAFDFLRIFACFMVIINHTNSWVFNNFFPSVSGQVSLALFFLSKTAVPIFFMISGALLLGKCDSYRIAYGKRALRIAVDILIFSAVTVCLIDNNFSRLNWKFFRSLITEPCILPYWYLYSYLSLMLFLPFLQKMVSVLSKKDLLILISIFFGFKQVVPFLTILGFEVSVSTFFTDNFFAGGIFYFLLGYFISHYFLEYVKQDKKRRWITSICSCVLIAGGILFCWYWTSLEYYHTGKFSLDLDNIYNLPIAVYSSAMFILVSVVFYKCKLSARLSKVVCEIGQATFGVYLIHSAVIIRMKNMLEYLCGRMNDLAAVLIMDVVLFIGCTIVIILIRKLPVFKKIL